MTRITGARTLDLRAPTSRTLAGSDAVHQDPDYSGAYVVLSTDGEHEGVGMTFTLGRGNDLCCAAIEQLAPLVVGRDLAELVADGAGSWRRLTSDGQLRWLGPEKGVIHLATAAIVNAVWDLWAKVERKPLWRLVCDLSPEALVAQVDFRYLSDVLQPDEAIELLGALERDSSGAGRRARAGRLPRLHHLGRVARLRRGEGAAAVSRGRR